MGVCNCSMFCCTLRYAYSSFTIILMGKRELVALISLSSWCLVIVVWLFLAVPWVCLQFVIVVFPDHTRLLFLNGPQSTCQRNAIPMAFRGRFDSGPRLHTGWGLCHIRVFTCKKWVDKISLFFMWTAKTPIRLGEFSVRSDFFAGRTSHYYFVMQWWSYANP